MKIEICANSYQSAVNAEASGADRIELCSELAVGGITPSFGLIKKIKQDLRIPVHVLIRPRSGDFTYSNADFEVMKQDVMFCKNLGCEGVVSGVLNADNTIDLERTKELIELAMPMSFTFHRAFDWVVNPLKSLDELKEIGVKIILTSGQEDQAVKGIELLKKLKDRAGVFIEIMPGGGVNIDTILVFKKAGFKQVHFSATSLYSTQKKVNVTMNSDRFFDETLVAISDSEKIINMINMVK